MKSGKFRRSRNVEDFRDPVKPVPPVDPTEFSESINDMPKITNSTLADDLGGGDILPKK